MSFDLSDMGRGKLRYDQLIDRMQDIDAAKPNARSMYRICIYSCSVASERLSSGPYKAMINENNFIQAKNRCTS